MRREIWKRFTARISGGDEQSARFKVAVAAIAGALVCGGPTANAADSAAVHAKAEHVVLMVWDGMRPDFITPEGAPTLRILADGGTFFANHHSVYISTTEVNGTALATGCYPNRSTVLANREYRPDLNLVRSFPTESLAYMRLADALTDHHYLAVPTLAETIQAAGFPTIIAGAKPVVCLHDRSLERATAAAKASVLLYAGATEPQSALAALEEALGPFPLPPALPYVPNLDQNNWTTDALTQVLWKDGVPKFTLLWLSNPDHMQHQIGPGAPPSLETIRNCDSNLATVLGALEAKKVRDKTDVLIVSDHGFSTVNRAIELPLLLRRAGFPVFREFHQTPEPGEILTVALGGSNLFYVTGHDEATIQRLVDFLQGTDFCGPIFTRAGLPGTLPLKDVRLDTPYAPDIVFAYRWTEDKNYFGAPGSLASEGLAASKRLGFGTHGSLSRYDLHNTLVANGPDFRAGFRDELPTANVDVAPTILHLLGIDQLQPMDGRVITEALAGQTAPPPVVEKKTLSARRKTDTIAWEQTLHVTTVNGKVYLDDGNAGAPEVGQ